jgi:hypothetical protein
MRPRGLTLIDLLVIALLIALVCALILPVFAATREGSRRTQCAQTINAIGKAMFMYADAPANRIFPSRGTAADAYADAQPLATLGLLYNKYVADPRVFSCPSRPVDPKLLEAIKPGGAVASSYAYDPGHSPKDNPGTVILGDMKGAGRNSDNHGNGVGQNIFTISGTDQWANTPEQPSPDSKVDNIFQLDATIDRRIDAFIRQ